MKKYYTCPMVEIKAFDIEDVVMVSTNLSMEELNKLDDNTRNTVKATFKSSVKANTPSGIVVEW